MIILLEAFAMGLVVIARKVCGIPVAFPKELSLLLLDDENFVQDCAKTIMQVIETDDATLLAWKEIFWKHCNDHFHLEKQAERLLTEFKKLINEKKSIIIIFTFLCFG